MGLNTQNRKEPLNSVTHSVRAAQAVLQYGVGAMIDFPDQTLMTAAPEFWEKQVVSIHDERLQKALKVDYFGMPGGKDESEFRKGISYVRFPEWYFCPKCRMFQPLKKWYKDYKKRATQREREYDPYMIKNMRCTTCRQDLVVARIITACENGHINDFPWVEWVHRKNSYGTKEVCSNPSLTFKTGSSASEGLEGLRITCKTCKATTTLRDAFDPNIFENMDKKNNSKEFICSGNHPWKNKQEKCDKHPKSLQRGSSSVYFPITESSLVIPPYSERLNIKIEKSSSFKDCITTLYNIPKDMEVAMIKAQLSTWAHTIALEIGASDKQVESILKRKWLEDSQEQFDTMSVKYRAEEYEALNGTIAVKDLTSDDFVREEMNVNEYSIPGLKNISLIHKIREVRALTGFTRITPSNADDPRFVHIKEPETNWYPAYEVRGEGIFLEFAQEYINRWIDNNLEIITNRVNDLNNNYKESFMGQQKPRNITPKFLFLHTLSHLLIKQLSFECGYSIASLRERLYCSELEDGKEMAGIFIYTASGDSEGTLGGLVRQGRSDTLDRIFKRAVESAEVCSNDPVCILSHGQGRDSLNLAACHTCTLIPETSCEEFNIFLDRGAIVGTFDNKDIGFFSKQKKGDLKFI